MTANAYIISFVVCGKYPLCENNGISDGTLDDVIWTWFYDHQGIIGGAGINFVQDLPRFMVLLYALQRFRMKEWGRMPESKVHEGGKTTGLGAIIHGGEGKVFILPLGERDAGQHQLVLKGRGLDVRALEGKFPDIKEDGTVAKLYLGEEQRDSWATISREVMGAGTIAELMDRVPYMVLPNKFSISTATPRKGLGVDNTDVGSRTLYRAIVFRELGPIHQLVGKELMVAWWHCVKCTSAMSGRHRRVLKIGLLSSSYSVEAGNPSRRYLSRKPDVPSMQRRIEGHVKFLDLLNGPGLQSKKAIHQRGTDAGRTAEMWCLLTTLGYSVILRSRMLRSVFP